MAAAVNGVNSFEFVKIDDIPVQEAKDDATAANDPIRELKPENQDLKEEEVHLDWDQNDGNAAVANVTTGTIDTIPLEDIPIIILQQPHQRMNGAGRKKMNECGICHKSFPDAQILQEHISKCKIIGCPKCSFRTFEDSSFKAHWQTHQAELKTRLQPVITITEVKEPTVIDLECPNCKKMFRSKNQLYLHMFKCERLKCIHCDYETFKTFELKRHFQNTHRTPEEIVKKCPRCNKMLKNAHSLSTHMWICGKNPRCECDHCGYKTFNKWNLRAHILAKHMQPKIEKDPSHNIDDPENAAPPVPAIIDNGNPFTQKMCSICNKIFNNQRALSAHSIHCKLYKCSHCSFETFMKAHLKKHINQNHKAKPVPSKSSKAQPNSEATEQMCKICYEIFQSESAFREHALHCQEYNCPHCTYKTHIKADLDNHFIQKHEKEEELRKNGIECPKCGKLYKNKHVVTNHLRYCGKESLQCEYCPYKTKRRGILKAHVKTAHPLEYEGSEDESTAACPKCGQKLKLHETMTFHYFYCSKKPFLDCNMCTFKTRYGLCLKNHILRVHCQTHEQSYECPKCSGKLTTQETFKRHLFSCIPETVLRCSLCTYMTRDPSCLSDHVLDKHYKDDPSDTSDAKLIPCPKCGNKLKNPVSLRSHLIYCEKDPHLQCPFCPFKAKMKTILDRHVIAKHKKQK